MPVRYAQFYNVPFMWYTRVVEGVFSRGADVVCCHAATTAAARWSAGRDGSYKIRGVKGSTFTKIDSVR
jgi:hypothetical protein